jgi:anti-anti-sigma factor
MPTATVIQAPARLDSLTSGPFSTAVQQRIEGGEHRLILNLAALEYLSSAGVRALVVMQKTLAAKQGRMVLLSPRPQVKEVLRICGLENLAPQAESIEAAQQWVA